MHRKIVVYLRRAVEIDGVNNPSPFTPPDPEQNGELRTESEAAAYKTHIIT